MDACCRSTELEIVYKAGAKRRTIMSYKVKTNLRSACAVRQTVHAGNNFMPGIMPQLNSIKSAGKHPQRQAGRICKVEVSA